MMPNKPYYLSLITDLGVSTNFNFKFMIKIAKIHVLVFIDDILFVLLFIHMEEINIYKY